MEGAFVVGHHTVRVVLFTRCLPDPVGAFVCRDAGGIDEAHDDVGPDESELLVLAASQVFD